MNYINSLFHTIVSLSELDVRNEFEHQLYEQSCVHLTLALKISNLGMQKTLDDLEKENGHNTPDGGSEQPNK